MIIEFKGLKLKMGFFKPLYKLGFINTEYLYKQH